MFKKLTRALLCTVGILGAVQAGTVSGVVSDSSTTTGVQNAIVQLRSGTRVVVSDTTDNTGAYSFTADTGTYSLRVTLTGYTQKSVSATVTADPLAINVAIVKIPTYTVSGVVKDSAGAVISGVAVRRGGGTGNSDTTDAEGKFSFVGITGGQQQFTATKTGYSQRSVSLNVTKDTVLNIVMAAIVSTTISGKISDSTAGTAIAGAIVRLGFGGMGGRSDTTDAEGNYSIADVEAGQQQISVSATGYTSRTVNATVSSATPVVVNVKILKIVTSTVSGKVTDSVAGTALAGVIVRLGNTRSDTTDAEGNYSFADVAAGQQSLRASDSGYATKTVTVTVTSAPVTQNIQLVKIVYTTISGKVTDSTAGTALAGVIVRLGNTRSDTTDAEGNYSFADVASGQQSLRASDSGYVTKAVNVTVAGTPVTQNIPLFKIVYTTVSGKVTDSTSGTALAGVIVRLGSGMGGTGARLDTTDAEGNYSFANVASGTESIRASDSGYVTKTVSVTIASAAPVTQNIQLVASAYVKVSGIITDSVSGLPVAGVVVRLNTTGGRAAVDTTDATGAYVLDSVANGNQSVRVSKTGYVTKTVTIPFNGVTNVTLNIKISVQVATVTLGQTISLKPLFSMTSSNSIKLSNITGSGKLAVYSFNGKMLFSTAFSSGNSNIALPANISSGTAPYVISVKADGLVEKHTVVPVR